MYEVKSALQMSGRCFELGHSVGTFFTYVHVRTVQTAELVRMGDECGIRRPAQEIRHSTSTHNVMAMNRV